MNEESFVGPSNVLTPVPTPVYTPLGSEASMIHTPLSASTTTEESFSREKSLGFEEHKDTLEDSNEGFLVLVFCICDFTKASQSKILQSINFISSLSFFLWRKPAIETYEAK